VATNSGTFSVATEPEQHIKILGLRDILEGKYPLKVTFVPLERKEESCLGFGILDPGKLAVEILLVLASSNKPGCPARLPDSQSGNKKLRRS
jgi:hypothetical protein